MEAFSLLKYWKSVGAGNRSCSGAFPVTSGSNGTSTATIVAAGDFDSDADCNEDEGPFIDLEFAVPEEEARKLEREDGEFGEIVDEDEEEEEDEDDDDGGEEREFKLRPSSSTSSYENSDSNVVPLSPTEEVLFKGQIVRIQGEEDEDDGQEVSSKSGQIPISASLLRSATKFRVFMLKLKRSKSDSISSSTTTKSPKSQAQKQIQQQQSNRKFFTVKFKVEEVPVISLLSRASSNSKSSTTTTNAATEDGNPATSALDSGEEKRNKKEVIQKYLKLVKPLYIRVSKRNQPPPPESAEKTKAKVDEEEEVAAAPEKSEIKAQKVSTLSSVGLNLKGMSMSMSMMMAKKHLGKSKSAVLHTNSNSNSNSNTNGNANSNVGSNRRDDSLLQQQDGIQGAILHCKRSFNSSVFDVEEKEESVLTRSASDPSHEKKRTTTATETTREKADQHDVVAV